MPLTATQVKEAKAESKSRKLADGRGLYLLIQPNGAKYWRYKYRYAGKEKVLALGVYPEVSLKAARQAHQKARDRLADGSDPGEVRKVEKLTRHIASAESFEAIAREWFATKMKDKSQGHQDRTLRTLEKDLFPVLGGRPIAAITAPELLAALRRVEARGAIESAHRGKQTAGQVFRFAVATGRGYSDPSVSLKGALGTHQTKHHAAITDPSELGHLLVAMDGFQGGPVTKTALLLSPLLFQRPGEIRAMEWAEINWEESRWEIPAEKMKMRQPHIVPLSKQALALLRELQPMTGHRGKYVFPGQRGASRCLSENAVRVALRTMGFDNDTMTPHGFRATARTLLDEVLGYRPDWIEHQLAHAVRDTNGRAYNRTSHLADRAKMMQGWADYLDNLKLLANSSNVITGKFRADS
ncbi:tyrosine-type recombinase/integrase [Haliea sp. E17]|uniref:tyrosine-type recombinase/integrase n=1 Tax=Haliea sp. E17 TaxID=3401576 RepID=UPI003AAB22FD